VITYDNLNKLTHVRDDNWYSDTYNTYDRKYYRFSGYDLGHLTPSDITSYDKVTNHNSFSLYNQAPQLAGFNRGKWARLENSVYDTIRKYKRCCSNYWCNMIIIILNTYLNLELKYQYHITKLTINKIIYCWIALI
jgi:DNA/RNA endonuclease G (NUC1)